MQRRSFGKGAPKEAASKATLPKGSPRDAAADLKYFSAWRSSDLEEALACVARPAFRASALKHPAKSTIDKLKAMTTRVKCRERALELLASVTKASAQCSASTMLTLEDVGLECSKAFDESVSVYVERRDAMLALGTSRGEVQAFQLLLLSDVAEAEFDAFLEVVIATPQRKQLRSALVFVMWLCLGAAEIRPRLEEDAYVGALASVKSSQDLDRLLGFEEVGGSAAKRPRGGASAARPSAEFLEAVEGLQLALRRAEVEAEAERTALQTAWEELHARERALEERSRDIELWLAPESLDRFLDSCLEGVFSSVEIAREAKCLERLESLEDASLGRHVASLRRRLLSFTSQAQALLEEKKRCNSAAKETLALDGAAVQELVDEVNAFAEPFGVPAVTAPSGTLSSMVVVLRKVPAALKAALGAVRAQSAAPP